MSVDATESRRERRPGRSAREGRVAVITGPRAVELRREAPAQPAHGEALIRIAACGVCTLEKALFNGDMRFYSVAPGHEVAGIVEALVDPAGLSDLTPGDVVAVDLLTRCGACAPCRAGHSAVCDATQGGALRDGTRTMGAGFSDFVVAPLRQVWSLGESSVESASMAEPLACVVHSLRRGGADPGDRIAVVGAGFMGRLHLAVLQARGCDDVGVVELDEGRRDEAYAAGARWAAAPEATGERRADLVFVTAANADSFQLAMRLCEDGGRIVVFGGDAASGAVTLDAYEVHQREISVLGSYSQEPADWRSASSLLRSGALESALQRLVTARYALDEVAAALVHAADEPVYRVLVVPELES
jgi:L-iditol 2-dehydrogenase